jgi:hypothetical protein
VDEFATVPMGDSPTSAGLEHANVTENIRSVT